MEGMVCEWVTGGRVGGKVGGVEKVRLFPRLRMNDSLTLFGRGKVVDATSPLPPVSCIVP